MSTESAGALLSARYEQLRQNKNQPTAKNDGVQIIAPAKTKPKIDHETTVSLAIRPVVNSWEELVETLDGYGALDKTGLYRQCILRTVRDLYNQGYGSELVTTAELAKDLATEAAPSHYFARCVSKKKGKWHAVTLEMVRSTWEVRKNTQLVIEKLKLDEKSIEYVLSLAWKFKGSLVRFLGIATEQGYGIKNPAGYFFGIIKNIQAKT